VVRRMLPWLIMILVVITIIVVTAVLLWSYLMQDNNRDLIGAASGVSNVEAGRMPAEKVRELTVEVKDVLTNLKTGEFIKISFAFEMTNEPGKEEFTLLDFKIRAVIINTLSDLTPEDVAGSKGKDYISSTLMNEINGILQKGKVRAINITDFVLS